MTPKRKSPPPNLLKIPVLTTPTKNITTQLLTVLSDIVVSSCQVLTAITTRVPDLWNTPSGCQSCLRTVKTVHPHYVLKAKCN